MDFTMSDKQKEWLGRVQSFMTKHVRPAVPVYRQQDEQGARWKVIPVLEDLKKKAKAEGLWNMFMPPSSHEDDEFRGAGLSNLEYAPLAEEMGHISWASEVFNCSAPDTGNMEVLMRYGSQGAQAQVAQAADGGRDPLRLPDDRTGGGLVGRHQYRDADRADGDHYVINGRKWWSSGVGDPRCKIAILMGKTDPKRGAAPAAVADPGAARHPRHHRGKDAAGVRLDDAPHGHAQVLLENVRVPASNSCSARAGDSRSRRAVSAPGASITACAPSARPRRRWRRW